MFLQTFSKKEKQLADKKRVAPKKTEAPKKRQFRSPTSVEPPQSDRCSVSPVPSAVSDSGHDTCPTLVM